MACQLPESCNILYRSGDTCKEAPGTTLMKAEADKYNRATFEPVETTALRIEVQMKPNLSSGILEWKTETAK